MTVFVDLLTAVGIGMVIAAVLFMKRAGDLVERQYEGGVLNEGFDHNTPWEDETGVTEEMKQHIYIMRLGGPVFFASIGLQTDIKSINATILLFSLCFVIVGMGAKIIGCGTVARLCGFKGRDKWKIGAGMMTRGEVALIVAQRGLTVGMLEGAYFTSVILLIIISSIVTPIVLKLLYAEKGTAVKETAKV
jgi:Kef-type K+ transport system membrane component KefB